MCTMLEYPGSINVNTNVLYKAPVTPIDASFGIVKPISSKSMPTRQMVVRERKNGMGDVTVVFAVRYVGCSSCREHALQIVELANAVNGVVPVAVVKETGVNDEALLEFHQDYFERNSLYKDDGWQLYRAMGGRRLSSWTVLKRMVPFRRRAKQKQIESRRIKG